VTKDAILKRRRI